jgi:hypothetical protein
MLAIEKELDARTDIRNRIGRFRSVFVRWCAKQRFVYQSNLQEECSIFENKYIFSRIYNVCAKEWKLISKRVFQRDFFTCQYCGQKGGTLEVDHIIPISKGGTNHDKNLATSCRTCNRKKRDKTAEQYKKWMKDKYEHKTTRATAF